MTSWMRFGKASRILAAGASRSDCSNVSNDPSAPIADFPASSRPLVGASRALALRDIQLRDNLFLDVAQAVLAKEDLLADEEGRRTERAAIDRVVGVLDQLFLDVVLLRARDETVDVEA